MKKILWLFLIIFSSPCWVLGQSKMDITHFKHSTDTSSSSINNIISRNNDNEFELLFSGLFLFYKRFFSSQDIPGACSFTPSCSEYGLLSIKKRGVVFGILNTFDRLTRCNGISQHQYTVDSPTGKYLDLP